LVKEIHSCQDHYKELSLNITALELMCWVATYACHELFDFVTRFIPSRVSILVSLSLVDILRTN